MNLGTWMLIVVDGPSEASLGTSNECARAVTRLVEAAFGVECANGATVTYWSHIASSRSPLRGKKRSLRGYAAKAEYMVKLAEETAYGAVMLVDNDNDTRQDRLAELRRGVNKAGLTDRAAVGVAREMLESWLLADPDLLAERLPGGKSCETLWG